MTYVVALLVASLVTYLYNKENGALAPSLQIEKLAGVFIATFLIAVGIFSWLQLNS